jgi:sugar O-acyltransferase (sialic acid O-acetyltransferase NeuD family)
MKTYPKKIAIVGFGGFASEFYSYLINDNICQPQRIEFFVESKYRPFEEIENLFDLSYLVKNIDDYIVYIAIGDPKTRKKIVEYLPFSAVYGTFIHSSCIITGKDVSIGHGSIICPGTIITTNVTIGKHSQLNLQTSIGHDSVICDYFTSAPKVSISGNNFIGDLVYIGTNSCTKEKVTIMKNVTIGLNSGVVKDINEAGVYIGTPCIKIK